MPHSEVNPGLAAAITGHRHLEMPQAEGQPKAFIFQCVFCSVKPKTAARRKGKRLLCLVSLLGPGSSASARFSLECELLPCGTVLGLVPWPIPTRCQQAPHPELWSFTLRRSCHGQQPSL